MLIFKVFAKRQKTYFGVFWCKTPEKGLFSVSNRCRNGFPLLIRIVSKRNHGYRAHRWKKVDWRFSSLLVAPTDHCGRGCFLLCDRLSAWNMWQCRYQSVLLFLVLLLFLTGNKVTGCSIHWFTWLHETQVTCEKSCIMFFSNRKREA